MMRTSSILIITCLVFASQCNQKEKDSTLAVADPIFQFLPPSKSIYGEWEDHSIFIYSANLTLNKNGTFDFRDDGCTQHSYSKGTWTMKYGFIELTSFNEYNESNKQHVPSYVSVKGDQSSKKNNYKPTVIFFDTSMLHEQFKYNPDSVLVYFDKRKFVLKNDTLFGVTTLSKFAKQQNILFKNSEIRKKINPSIFQNTQ